MLKLRPRNYNCVACGKKQCTREECLGCGGVEFTTIKKLGNITLTLSEKEVKIIKDWGFKVSTERPLSEEEMELLYRIASN